MSPIRRVRRPCWHGWSRRSQAETIFDTRSAHRRTRARPQQLELWPRPWGAGTGLGRVAGALRRCVEAAALGWGWLREAYGTPVGEPSSLFSQHTYLTIVAKTIAARVLDLQADDAAAILSGRALDEVGIQGAVESDFFDWIRRGRLRAAIWSSASPDRPARFRLPRCRSGCPEITLYESLIDPAQRRDLGEYYTPDWLAAKIVHRALTNPLEQRVLDPGLRLGHFSIPRHPASRSWPQREAAGLARARGSRKGGLRPTGARPGHAPCRGDHRPGHLAIGAGSRD